MSENSSDGLMSEINGTIRQYMDSIKWFEYSENRLTKHGAGIYVQQHGVFTRHSRCCWANVVGNCPEVEVRRFIVRENLYEEEGIPEESHYLKLVRMGVAVGLREDEVHEADGLPSTRAGMLIWETLTRDHHWLIGCTAKACLEQVNQVVCGEMSNNEARRWMARLGLSAYDVDFWMLHDELDKVHGSGAFDAVVRYLPQSTVITRADVMQAVEDSMFAWKIFLDGIAEAAEGEAIAAQ
ncbi:MAG: iron-containing redox enzyme family protein [Alphaproteobacteria bacterium]